MALDVGGILLIFLFGLRHGMAADHIAVIDGLGIHLHHQGKYWIIPWLGTLFAAGHGIIITLYIIFANVGLKSLHLDRFKWLDWIPIILLFGIAFLNLKNLRKGARTKHIHPAHGNVFGAKKGTLSAVLISVCMVMVFDTLADAAAWGYSASSSRSFLAALVVGFVFTLGMIITDTVDSRLLAKTIEAAPNNKNVAKQRSILSWVIVIFSFGIGLQKLIAMLRPSFELSEGIDLVVGISLLLIVSLSYIKIYRAIEAK